MKTPAKLVLVSLMCTYVCEFIMSCSEDCQMKENVKTGTQQERHHCFNHHGALNQKHRKRTHPISLGLESALVQVDLKKQHVSF